MRSRGLVLGLFFLSGAAGLVYEVVWTRQLALVFGVTVFAAAAVLAAFMAGLALGSWLYGRMADRSRSPLRSYALLEAGIGLAALAMPLLFDLVQPLYVRLAVALEDRFLLFNWARALLAAIPLLLPTTLMGATVPAMARFLVERRQRMGWNVGLLYAVNTSGAVAGCLAAGFLLVPFLPLTWVVYGTAAVNLGIAALLLASGAGKAQGDAAARSEVGPPSAIPEPAGRLGAMGCLAIAVFGLSGFAALGYEILWTRTLVLYVHNSTYAFTLMLAVFLVGLAVGDALLLRLYDHLARPLLWLGLIEVGIGLSVALAVAAYRSLPSLSRELLGLSALHSWGQSVALISIRAALVLLPTTILLGAVFPLVARIVCGELASLGRRLGTAYAVNTAGAVAGLLVTTFVLIPSLGLRGSLVALSVLSAALGTVCMTVGAARATSRWGWLAVGLSAALVPILATPPNLFEHVFERGPWKLVFYREGVTDTTGVWEHRRTGERHVTYGDQRGTAGTMTNSLNRRQAHMAHLLHPRPWRSLQIGFGVGNTLAAAALTPEVEELDCVELSPQVRETASYFWTNEGVLENPKVRLIIDDGRNFLLRTRRRYDVITLEPPEIFTAEVVNLYTKEFYQLAAAALTDGGLLSQWIPAYTMGELEIKMLVRSLLEVYPEVSLWEQGHRVEGKGAGRASTLLVIAAKRPLSIDRAALARRMSASPLREDLERIETETPADLLALYIAGTERLRRWVADVRPVTDDWTFVDFQSARRAVSRFGFGQFRFHEQIKGTPEEMAHRAALGALVAGLREPAP